MSTSLGWFRTREGAGLLLVLLVGILIRLWAIPTFEAPPNGPVDVYYVDGWAAHSVLELSSPYSQNYSIPAAGTGIFVYLPFVPIYYAPFYLMGDIRYGNVFADVLVMISLYSIASKFFTKHKVYASLLYALLPPSIWLTSVSSTNMMIGIAMLAVSFALIMNERFLLGSLFFGIAIATNQFVILTIPLVAYHFWKKRKLLQLFVAGVSALLIILPFFLLDPARFSYGVLSFQFERPLQANGSFSLYSTLYALLGYKLETWIRVTIVAILSVITLAWFTGNERIRFLPSVILLLSIGAFVLPVNGFWNYFLLPLAFSSLGLSVLLQRVSQPTKNDKSIDEQTIR